MSEIYKKSSISLKIAILRKNLGGEADKFLTILHGVWAFREGSKI